MGTTADTHSGAVRHATYVGRVGALAIALGVGFAIAGLPATAHADSDTSSAAKPAKAASDGRDGGASRRAGAAKRPIPKREGSGTGGNGGGRTERQDAGAPTDPAKPDGGATGTAGAAKDDGAPSATRADDGAGATADRPTKPSGAGPGTARTSTARANISRPIVRRTSTLDAITNRSSAASSPASAPQTADVAATQSVRPAAKVDLDAAVRTAMKAVTAAVAPDTVAADAVARATTVVASTLATDLRPPTAPTVPRVPTAPLAALSLWSALAGAKQQFDDIAKTLMSDLAAAFTIPSTSQTTTARTAALKVAANAAPVAGQPTFGTPNATTGAVTGSLNVTDPNGKALTYAVTSAPVGGSLTVNKDGTFTYTPTQVTRMAAGASLTPVTDSFVVTVSNGTAKTTVNVAAPVYSGQLSTGQATQVGQSPTGIVTYGNRIYTANTLGNSITAVDAGSNGVIATVAVGKAPTALALSPDGNTLYVANSGDNTVTSLNTVTGATLAVMPVGNSPQGISVNAAGTRIYVTNTASNTVTVLNAATGKTVTTVGVGSAPVGVTTSADGSRVYVANRGGNTVSVINTSTNKVVGTYAVGSTPQGLALNSAGTRLYVTNSGSDNVTVLNTATGATVATIAVRDQPYGIVLSKDGTLAYVANSDSSVSVINTVTNTKVTGTLRTETATGSMVALSPDGNTLYTTFSGGTTYRTASLVHVASAPATNPGTTTAAVTDDFSGAAGSAPNSALWSYQLGAGGSTGQLNAYTDSPANASLDGDGHLVITAMQQQLNVPGYGTYDYTSAYLTTQDKLEFTYGTVAASIKFPAEQGVLPAFWMLGSDTDTVGWPAGGEIDVMEVANPGVAGSSIHATGVDLSTLTTQDLSSDYHTYWVNWAPNKITTGIDDTTLTTFTPDDLPPGAAWTFNDRSMYVILNVAVGSPFGQPDATTQLPAQMDVDWVSYTPLTTSV